MWLSDLDIEKRFNRAKGLLKIYVEETRDLFVFFSNEKIFKVKQQYNSKNYVFYIPKKMRKKDVSDERLLREHSGFPKKVMVSLAISKAGKTSVIFVEPGAKVNAEYYTKVLLKQMIPK